MDLPVPPAVVALVADLMFSSKIDATARALGIPVTFVATLEQALDAVRTAPRLVLLDLTDPTATMFLAALRTLIADPAHPRPRTVGFVPHVQRDLAAQARALGCEAVMPRSEFVRDLPALLVN